jgi:hypothetical protein
VPNHPAFGEGAGRSRGVDSSFALADPSYRNALELLTGRPGLAKVLGPCCTDSGGVWMLTDLTTVRTFEMQPVSIETSPGSFVEPTPESLRAAVAAMPKNDQGIRLPDPTSTAGYPLTYVVYAIAPAEPLRDEAGACRTSSQELLAKWLTHLVRDGQSQLPAGMEPLSPELGVEAEEALQRVGRSGNTDCPVPDIPAPGGSVPPPAPAPSISSTPAPSSAAAPSASRASTVVAVDDLVEQANAELTLAEDDENPGFLGGALPSVVAAMGALLAVGVLTAVAARQTGNRALPPGPQMTRLPDPPAGAGP